MIEKRFNIIKKRFKIYKEELKKIENKKYVYFSKKLKNIISNFLFLKFLTKNSSINNDPNLFEKKILQFFYFSIGTVFFAVMGILKIVLFEENTLSDFLLLTMSIIWFLMIFSSNILNVFNSNIFYKKMMSKNKKLTKKEIENFIKSGNLAECFNNMLSESTSLEIIIESREIIKICKNEENNINSKYFYDFHLKPSLLEEYKNKKIDFENLVKKINLYISELNLDKEEVSDLYKFVEQEKKYFEQIENIKNIEKSLLNNNIIEKKIVNF
tara:strand:- start:26279 stop:27088 length:810 start_codon:yes stop_codon:yes gene_type:complete